MRVLKKSDQVMMALLRDTYGYDDKEIASTVGQPVTVVQMVLDERKAHSKAISPVEDKEALIGQEARKQLLFAPMYMRAEAGILDALNTVIENINPDDDDATARLAGCAKVYKDIKAGAMSQQLDTPSGAGMVVQILNNL